MRAQTAQGLEERLNCLSRIIALDPQHPAAQTALHQSLQRFLEDDAFLAYVGESSAMYYTRTTTALYLATAWFLLSFVATILFGTRLRRANQFLSAAWLAAVLLLGDVWALLTFGVPREVESLTEIVLAIGLLWIWRLTDRSW